MTAYDLGRIVTHFLNEKGDVVSHKKLQKLLYYIDAWHMVYFDHALLDEEFEAWVHGPVISSLYGELKEAGFNNLKLVNDDFDSDDGEINELIAKYLTDDQNELINAVLNKYGGLTAFELEMLVHSEPPWIEARKGYAPHEACKKRISKEQMKQYYASTLKTQ